MNKSRGGTDEVQLLYARRQLVHKFGRFAHRLDILRKSLQT